MIVQCLDCGKRFVATPGEPVESPICRRCAGQGAKAAEPKAVPTAPAPSPTQRWVSSAPIASLRTSRPAPLPAPMPDPPVAAAPDPDPDPEPAPAPAAPAASPAGRRRPNGPGWGVGLLALAASMAIHAALWLAIEPGIPSAGASVSLAGSSRVRLESGRRASLTHLDFSGAIAAAIDADPPAGIDPPRDRDDALQRALATIPMGHPTDTDVRVLALDDPELNRATTVPISVAGRDPIDLATAAGGPAVRANFMGIEASGRRFCIIADRSGSMQWDGKIEHMKREILKTVGDLKGGARFYVILFSDQAEAIPADRWLGGKADVDATDRWLRGVQAGGGTFPLTAFQAALRMRPRPDAIFFMTDGIFPVDVAPAVASMNNASRKRVPIYTISFLDPGAEELLRMIARQSGGSYRHVSGF